MYPWLRNTHYSPSAAFNVSNMVEIDQLNWIAYSSPKYPRWWNCQCRRIPNVSELFSLQFHPQFTWYKNQTVVPNEIYSSWPALHSFPRILPKYHHLNMIIKIKPHYFLKMKTLALLLILSQNIQLVVTSRSKSLAGWHYTCEVNRPCHLLWAIVSQEGLHHL